MSTNEPIPLFISPNTCGYLKDMDVVTGVQKQLQLVVLVLEFDNVLLQFFQLAHRHPPLTLDQFSHLLAPFLNGLDEFAEDPLALLRR